MTIKQQICEYCNQEYTPTRGPCKNRRQRFCSNKCRGEALHSHNYRGGTYDRHGYKLVYSKERGKEIPEHRLIMEKVIGRKLLRSEVIHHKDKNRSNNSIENLEIISSQAIHATKHSTVFRSETHKECKMCHIIKTRSDFLKTPKPGLSDQHDTYCIECKHSYDKRRYEKKKIVKL